MWFLFLFLFVSVSVAESLEGPVMCTASWRPPPVKRDKKWDPERPVCELQGAWAVSAAGPTEKKADLWAQTRLDDVLDATFEARVTRVRGSLAEAVAIPQQQLCLAQFSKQKEVTCRPDPGLALHRYCFVKFEAPECWAGMGFEFDGFAVWKAMKKGTERMCKQVEEALVTDGVAPEDRLECRAQCLQEVQVQCSDL